VQNHEAASDYDFWREDIFSDPAFPAAYFIEHSYANDPTNWFIPNHSGAEAMLRSAGLQIVSHPESETWICRPGTTQRAGRFIVEMELDGTL
jgi:tRNA (mo5U34)-methyltransferase